MAPIHNLSHALHTAAGDKAPLHLVANRASGSGEGGGLAAPITKKVTIAGTNYRLNAVAPAVATTTPKPPAASPTPTTSSQPNYSAWVTQLGQDLYRRTLTNAEVDSWVAKLKKGK